jgi:hypothetical protein
MTEQDHRYAQKVCVYPSNFALWKMCYCYSLNPSQMTSPGFEPCHVETWKTALVAAVGCTLSRGDVGADGSAQALTHKD